MKKVFLLLSLMLIGCSTLHPSTDTTISGQVTPTNDRSPSSTSEVAMALSTPQVIVALGNEQQLSSLLIRLKKISTCMMWGEKDSNLEDRNNRIDDDGNGFIDDFQGWSFEPYPSPNLPSSVMHLFSELPRYVLNGSFPLDSQHSNCIVVLPVVLSFDQEKQQQQVDYYLGNSQKNHILKNESYFLYRKTFFLIPAQLTPKGHAPPKSPKEGYNIIRY